MAISSRFTTLLSVLLTIISLQVTAEEQAKIRIMPLGDSITEGCCGDNGPPEGYRGPLYDGLIERSFYDEQKIGYDVSFVGSVQHGGTDPDHEGHSSFTAAKLLECIQGVKSFSFGSGYCEAGNKLTEHEPSIILYHIGTNDLLATYEQRPDLPPDIDEDKRKQIGNWKLCSPTASDPLCDQCILDQVEPIVDDVRKTLNYIYNSDPSISIVLAEIILTRGNDEAEKDNQNRRTKVYNKRLRELADEFSNNGFSITIVNMQAKLTDPSQFTHLKTTYPEVHPNNDGFKKMTTVWYAELDNHVLIRPAPLEPKREPNLLGQADTQNGFLIDGILDHLYGLDNLRRISDGADQVWLNHGEGAVTAKATFTEVDVPDSPQKGRILGFLDVDDEFHRIFELDGAQDLNKEGGIGFGRLPIQEQLPAFRWGIDPHFSSQPDENPDQSDHMVTWLVTDGKSKGNYVFAWEDFEDRDFNDLVVEVSNVAPLKQTPVFPSPNEPDLLGQAQAKDDGSGILMDGILDELYGLENLTRIPDDDEQFWVNLGNGSAMAKAAFTNVTPDNFRSLGVIGANGVARDFLFVLKPGLGDLGTGGIPSKDIVPVFRWHLGAAFTSLNSQPSGNRDRKDRMVTYRITGREHTNEEGDVVTNALGNFVLAWDDGNRGDSDHQDLVVEVSGVVAAPQVNERIVPLSKDDVITEYIPPAPGEPGPEGGVFTITATFANNSGQDIKKPFFAVVGLSGGNTLLNAEGKPGGVGSIIWVDGDWKSGDPRVVEFRIGLSAKDRFSFFVDLFEGASPDSESQ